MPVDSAGFPVLSSPIQAARANAIRQTQGGRISQRGVIPIAIKTQHLTDGSVTNIKIDSLSASKINTGTLTVKDGTDNVKISVVDANDVEIVTLDTSGITVNTGKVTIKDGDETTIIDSSGLVSTANFISDQTGVLDGSSTTTTSTTLVDMNGMTLDSFNINRSIVILALLTVRMYISVDTENVRGHIFIGGDINDVQEVRIRTAQTTSLTLTTHNFRTITASSPPTAYTIKARWLVSGGTGTALERQISYLQYGK